jgi:aminoglycoside phosphotransferase (APT) family kinase protein
VVTPDAARLTGVRMAYAHLPVKVRRWVESELGAPVSSVTPRTGGMSPAVAASLEAENGRRAFVKAVGASIHPDTPDHFRHEIAVLSQLPPAPYRAGLQATYDDGDWVAILLEDVDGDHPDWRDANQVEAVFEVVRAQSHELTPPPPGLPTVSNRQGMQKYVDASVQASDAELAAFPAWGRQRFADLLALQRRALERHRDESFCHWDIRHDNILVRSSDGQPVLVDWGMARRAQRWGDIMCFGLEWVETPRFDRIVGRLDLSRDEEEDVSGFLAGLGSYCLIMATRPPHPSLPNLPAFRREVGRRCLAGVRRRLSA